MGECRPGGQRTCTTDADAGLEAGAPVRGPAHLYEAGAPVRGPAHLYEAGAPVRRICDNSMRYDVTH